MTEGILIREMMADPLLKSYSVVMLDEVHERTLYTDILMGLMRKILKVNYTNQNKFYYILNYYTIFLIETERIKINCSISDNGCARIATVLQLK